MKAGNVYQAGPDKYWTAAIDDGTWYEKIRAFGETEASARDLRDRILVAIDRRKHPRRLVDCAPRGHRRAIFDRRSVNGRRVSVPPDAQINRRMCAAPAAEVGIRRIFRLPLRRKGDERRKDPIHREYKWSPDPRIRALERRKV